MDRFRKLLGLAGLGTLLMAAPSFADPLIYRSFTDNHNYWLQGQAGNWANSSTTGGYVDNTLDNIGTPNFLNGTVGLNTSGGLVSISINYTNGSGLEQIGDFFIDANSDNYWDYVVKMYNAPGHTPGAAGVYDVYSAHLDMTKGTSTENNSRYYMSGNDNTGNWAGYLIRDDHPFAAKESQLGPIAGQVSFSGWNTQWGPNTSTFTFGANNSALPDLDGSKLFTIAWDPNCANDVLFEQVAALPLPSSLFMMGSGLVGLLGLRRRGK